MPSNKYNPTVKSSKVLYCPADLYAGHCASATKPLSKEKLRRLLKTKEGKEAFLKSMKKTVDNTIAIIDKSFKK